MNSGKHKIKIMPIEDLRVGMFIQDVGRSWFRHPWLTKSKLLTSTREIQALATYGIREVAVNLSLGVNPIELDKEDRGKAGSPPRRPQPGKLEEVERRVSVRPEVAAETQVSWEEEISQVYEVRFRALQSVRISLESFRSGRPANLELARESVTEIIDSVMRNRDAFLSLLKLRTHDHYDYNHPLNVAVLAVSFGRHIGLDRSQMSDLGLGCLLQDIGKTKVPPEILEKPGPLTGDEFELVKKHPVWGVKMLNECRGALPRPALSTALYHHERFDGGGYPAGHAGSRLNPYVIIAGLADVFDAVSSDRPYNRGYQPFQALQVLFRLRGEAFPAEWVDRFIQCTGIYPTGTVVELNTGEMAVVTAVNHGQLLRPKITIISDAQGRPAKRWRNIDLNTETYKDRAVARVLDPRRAGVNPAVIVDPNFPG
ncbi:MAG: HD-GYP domain-containing protein [Pseudomonadota bacterium]